jgi:hemerythrin-like domain-containing protein
MTNPNPDTLAAELLRFHRVITRALTVSLETARAFVRGGFPGAAMKRGYLDYVKCLAILTRAHHDTEDDLVFPVFRARLPEVPFKTLDAQHEELLPLLDAVAALVEAGASGRSESQWLPALGLSLERLGRLWASHIDLEERYLSEAAIGRICPPEEQEELRRQFSEHGQKLAQPASLILPFILYNLDPAQRQLLMAKLPPPVTKQLIPVDWKEAWSPMKPFLLD